ncbi:MAG: hypothetical protein QOK39_1117 [Acidimicrobiaceae bacterium]|nr:hypothetical protein [Acidimicrobiaceae bacterium]
MFRKAASSETSRGGTYRGLGRADDKLTVDLQDAWRLSYVVVADGELATRAVSKAYVSAAGGDAASTPSRVELFEAALRISLTRAAESPDRETTSEVTAALWRLSGQQRAALWLTTVNQLDNSTLGAILGLTAPDAGEVAGRAKEWLDVALDHDSGPLCEFETELADFAEGKLPADEVTEIEDHLPDCPTCATRLRAREELGDLKSILTKAVPEAPPGLTFDVLELEERGDAGEGTATLADGPGRTPALRPLAACCAALLILAVVGIALVRPGRSGGDPVRTTDSPATLSTQTNSSPAGGATGLSANFSGGGATTITITTTSVPAVTFPTIPGRKGKP